MAPQNELLNHHIADTRERLTKIEEKLDALSDFKSGLLAQSKMMSLFVSAIGGIITLIISHFLENLKNR